MGDFEKFYNRALKFLSYRPRSEKEVRDRLKFKILASLRSGQNSKFKIEESIIDKVIEKLKEQKFINDEEFARWWIESRLRYKPRSINLIKRELLQKGISKEFIDAQISNFIHSTSSGQISNELENAQKLIAKKLPRYIGLTKNKIYEKLSRFLASKGFDWNTIKKSIDESLEKGV